MNEAKLFEVLGRLYAAFQMRGDLLTETQQKVAALQRELDLTNGQLVEMKKAEPGA